MMPFPQLPKKPKPGAAKLPGSNHSETHLKMCTALGQFGRVASPLVEVDMPGENTNPLSITVIPEKVQWPSTLPTKSVRVRRNGKFQT
jgi:hypothetical protein